MPAHEDVSPDLRRTSQGPLLPVAFRQLGGAAAINGTGFILASVVTVAWYFILVRQYATSESAQLLLALSVAGLINLLDLGISLGLVRVISSGNPAAYSHPAFAYFHSAIVVTGLSETMLGSLGVWAWRTQASAATPLIACACIVVFALSTEAVLLCVSAFKGLCEFKIANLISTGSTLVVYAVSAPCIMLGLGAWSLLALMTGLQACCAVAAVYFTYRRLRRTLDPSDQTAPMSSVYRDLLQVSLTFFPQLSTGILFMHAQRFLVARYAGVDFVAITSFAYSLATRMHAVASAFLEVVFPMAKQLRAAGLEAVSFSVRFGTVSAAIYLVAAALAATLVSLLAPSMTTMLLIFSLGVAFAVAVVPAFHLLNGSGASSQVSLCSLLSLVLFACLVPALHAIARLPTSLLLPTSYTVAMASIVPHVAILVIRHARRFNLGNGQRAGASHEHAA